jgi:hypothetical protein
MRDTCKILKCKYQSLSRWVKTYKQNKHLHRKIYKNHNLKIKPQTERFVKEYFRKYPTTILWEYAKLVYERFGVLLSDKSIYNILHENKITRK